MTSPTSKSSIDKKSVTLKSAKNISNSAKDNSSKQPEQSSREQEKLKHVTIPEIYERPKVGQTVKNKYNVIKELGEGGFGVVLEVVDRASSEHYAMKVSLKILYNAHFSFFFILFSKKF